SPFVQAKSLKVGVEMMPLIFSRTLNVTNLTLDQPQISLVKSENAQQWNFSSIGGKSSSTAAQTTTPAPEKTTPAGKESGAGSNPNLSVAKLDVTNGKLTVTRANSNQPMRIYDKVNIEFKNFSFANAFPFEMTADTPSGGTMKLSGN